MAKISVEEARQRLLQSIPVKEIPRRTMGIQSSTLTNDSEREDIEYIKNINDDIYLFKKGNTYIVSPADDILNPMIGEFDELPEDDEMPPNFEEWCENYSREVVFFQKNQNSVISNTATIELVDLGLSVEWGNMNLGARKPEDVGEYYAWGEMYPKTTYTWDTYIYSEGETNIQFLGKSIEKSEYDSAYVSDSKLCMPTAEQFSELIEKCVWTQTRLNNVDGWNIKGPNGNSIFLPFNGCKSESSTTTNNNIAYYWTSDSDVTNDKWATALKKPNSSSEIYQINKRTGLGIRPVSVKLMENTNIEFVNLGLTVEWANMNLGATRPEDIGNFYSWAETKVKSKYTETNYKYQGSSIGGTIQKTDKYDVSYIINQTMMIPNTPQLQELIEQCEWTETKLNNVDGWEVKGPNGNSIFLPSTGYKKNTISGRENGYYTSATNNSYKTSSFRPTLRLYKGQKPSIKNDTYKYAGIVIRPVLNTKKKKINPLIPYKWSQYAPFNGLLEKVTDKNGNQKTPVTGCPNTALGMIMAYYGCIGINGKKYRRGIKATKAYTSSVTNNTIKYTYRTPIPKQSSVDLFDYDNIDFKKPTDFKTEESKIAVGELIKHIAYSNFTNFSPTSSNASYSDEINTIVKNINLCDEIKLLMVGNFPDLSQFKETIYQEILQGYPVILSGFSQDGSSGHQFICDGYDPSTDKFHFNWGWGGSYDGWFDMTALTPGTGSRNYNYNKYFYSGLHPNYIFGDTNNDNEISVSDMTNITRAIINNENYNRQLDINSDNNVNSNDVAILQDNILHGSWPVKTRLVATFNVTSTTSETLLFNSSNISKIAEMEIDGKTQSNVTNSLVFSSTGNHTITLILKTNIISSSLFKDCNKMTSIIIPNGVLSIGSYAFQNCSNLANITCHSTTPPKIMSTTFQGVKSNGTLKIPTTSDYSSWMSTKNYYLGKYNWKLG